MLLLVGARLLRMRADSQIYTLTFAHLANACTISNHRALAIANARCCVQILLFYDGSGPFAAPNEPCPFRCLPLPDEQINAFDEQLTHLVTELSCDFVHEHLAAEAAAAGRWG